VVNLFGGRELALLEVCEPERVGDVVVFGREAERGLQVARGLVEMAEHELGLAEHLSSADAVRVRVERLARGVERLWIRARVEVRDGECDEHVRRAGAVARGRFKCFDRGLVVLLRRVNLSELRVSFDEYRAVLTLRARAVARASARLGRLVMRAYGVLLLLRRVEGDEY